jgi:hypothetical protein
VFGVNQSRAFKVNSFSGTFIAFNDGNAGFQDGFDSIIQFLLSRCEKTNIHCP